MYRNLLLKMKMTAAILVVNTINDKIHSLPLLSIFNKIIFYVRKYFRYPIFFKYFIDVNKEALFIPISLLISVSAIGLGYTSFIINTHNDPEDFEWIHDKSHFKFM